MYTSLSAIEFAEQRRQDLIADAVTFRTSRAVRRTRKVRRTRSGALASHPGRPLHTFRGWVATGQL
jgi:hypothetical protein